MACSSDDSAALNEWFGNQGLATSYGKNFLEIPISVKSLSTNYDSSAYMVISYAVLGNVNGMEHTLYFGLDSLLSESWKLRPDTVFYNSFYKGELPDEHKELQATIYWLKEDSTEHDTTWLKFEKPFVNSAEISIAWDDTLFVVPLPEELLKLKGNAILAAIKSNSNNSVLRIAPPNTVDIPGLLRVGQEVKLLKNCEACLHAGLRESLFVSFDIKSEYKARIAGETVVFAELLLPKESGDTAGSELGLPVPVYVHGEIYSENYNRVDSLYVKEYGYSNIVFCEGDSLKLQVTRSLRNYAFAKPLPDTIGFTLGLLDYPMPKSDSLYFYNRPAYSRYDFGSGFSGAKLKLWFADYGEDRK